LTAHLQLVPGHRVIDALALIPAKFFQVADLRQIKAPEIVLGADADIIATKDVQLIAVDEVSVVCAPLRLDALRSELIPVTVFVPLTICLDRSQVQ